MKRKAALPWMIVAGLWTFGTILAVGNHHHITEIHAIRESYEAQRNDVVFKLRHAASLSHIMRVHQEMVLTIDSLPIGLLGVNARMRRLCAAYHLEEVQFKAKPELATGSQVPLSMQAAGDLPNVVRLLMVLQENAYLAIDNTRIQIHPESRRASLDLELTLNYAIAPPSDGTPYGIRSAAMAAGDGR
jgi:hypothetical protein